MPSIKISNAFKWILTVLILGVLLVGTAYFYIGQQRNNSDLSGSLSQAQQDLIVNSALKDQYQSSLRQSGLALSASKALFFTSSQSMAVEEALFDAADEVGVVITTVSCSAPSAQVQGQTTYQVFSVGVNASGEVEKLRAFVGVLGDWLPSARIVSANVAIAGEGTASLNLTLTVYAL